MTTKRVEDPNDPYGAELEEQVPDAPPPLAPSQAFRDPAPTPREHLGIFRDAAEKQAFYAMAANVAKIRARIPEWAAAAELRMHKRDAAALLNISIDALKAIPLPGYLDPVVDGMLEMLRRVIDEHYED